MMEQLYDAYLKHRSVTTDSRNCPVGSIYFALRGDRFNGNDFALSALKAGCALAVVDDIRIRNEPGCLFVQDSLKALQDLALIHRQKAGALIIGITGTNGKTTTKELLAAVLSKKYKTWFTQGNFNNHIGVPLTILSMPVDTEVAVIEMGANHPHEIDFLCRIAQPDMGLITNVGKAHLQGFGSFEGVMKTKAELYEFLKRNPGIVFLNTDNDYLKAMLGEIDSEVIRYGTGSECYVKGSNASANPFLSFDWEAGNVKRQQVSMRLSGSYNFENALAAIAVGVYLKVPTDDINAALGHYRPVNHRSQILTTDANTIILDAYNANPTSMAAALDGFEKMLHKKKVLILGGMRELGNESESEHRLLVNRLLTMKFEKCWLVGEEFSALVPLDARFSFAENGDELCEILKVKPFSNSLVLVKGSRAHKLERVTTYL
ncbi:UDP-N-acetylmuramoyl-tripeptide--D-alanyl-D-alanine ligase [Geofilum sp. OHC36d9]|uniref:UDP-N-acetylmuramoyl-tripeptide--D-alanyl-D- alanine ligase n=1 Tax=Geofilum sp. OHC36d9 TaxID=3458413 RepID=UPI004033DAD7